MKPELSRDKLVHSMTNVIVIVLYSQNQDPTQASSLLQPVESARGRAESRKPGTVLRYRQCSATQPGHHKYHRLGS